MKPQESRRSNAISNKWSATCFTQITQTFASYMRLKKCIKSAFVVDEYMLAS